MRYIGADKRVGRGLYLSPVKTYKKYAVLFFAFAPLFFFANSASAVSPPIPNAQNSGKLAIQASVPLMPEFIYSIKKNSSIKLTKAAFSLGEEIRVQVKIVGGNNFPLRGHKINLQAVNKQEEVSLLFSGETNNDGLAHFSFSADEHLLGKNILRVIDATYDEPIIIVQEKVFIVYKPADDRRDRESAEQKIIVRKSVISEEIQFDEAGEIFSGDNILQNNGTIVVSASIHSPPKRSDDT